MPSNENLKQEESPKMSLIERMRDALSKNRIPPPSPPPPTPPLEEEGEFDFHEWAQKMVQEGVDNLNRNALKNG